MHGILQMPCIYYTKSNFSLHIEKKKLLTPLQNAKNLVIKPRSLLTPLQMFKVPYVVNLILYVVTEIFIRTASERSELRAKRAAHEVSEAVL